MKTISKEKISMAERLIELIAQRRKLEVEEKALKAYFKANLGANETLEAGDVLVSVVSKSRSSLDKTALVLKYGVDAIEEVTKLTEYLQVEVRERGAA